MSGFEARWAAAPDFAEFAEVLGIPTDHVVAALQNGLRAMVLYTPEDADGDEPPVYYVEMARGDGGIFQTYGEPKIVPNFWRDLKRKITKED